MIQITSIKINGQLIPLPDEPVNLLNQSDLESYRYELWGNIARQKGIEFDKQDAHTSVVFTYKTT